MGINPIFYKVYILIAIIAYWYFKSIFFTGDNREFKGTLNKMCIVLSLELVAMIMGFIWPISLFLIGSNKD